MTSYFAIGSSSTANEFRANETIAKLAVSNRIPAIDKKSQQIMKNVFCLLSDDSRWKQTQSFFATSELAIAKMILQNRPYYLGLVKNVVNGLGANPPKYVVADESMLTEEGSYAFVAFSGGPINIRLNYWTKSAHDQPYTLIHEYARVYLWNSISNDIPNTNDKTNIGNWDFVIGVLGDNYEKIISQK